MAQASDGKLEDVLDILYREHGYLNSLLDKLEQQGERLRTGRIPDFHLLRDSVDYLLHFPDRYHHPREDLLFASLLRRDPAFRQPLQRLEREHRTLHRYNSQLFDELSAVVAGGAVDRRELRHNIQRYVQGYRQHMQYESREVFPRARGKLSAAELRRLTRQTRFADDPLFGLELDARYQRLAHSLQTRLERVGADLLRGELGVIESAIETLARLSRDTGRLPAAWRERLQARRAKPGDTRTRPSWQARLLNSSTRLLLKPMMRFGSVESMRGMTDRFDEQQARFLPADLDVREVDRADYQGEWVRIQGLRPRRTLLYMPGGGFVMRTRTQHCGFVARICRAAHARALLVHYRLAPEVPFPGGLEDCLAAYHDLLRQGVKPANIVLAGDSAGGGLVLSTLLALRDEGSPMPGAAIVLSPLGDLTYSGASRQYNKHLDPMLPTHRASAMHELYLGDALPEDRYISPVLASFDGLPPILGQVGSTEILLDDTVRAAERAAEAGVPFYLEIWAEMPHVFPIFAVLPESDIAIERMARFINNRELEPLPAAHGYSEAQAPPENFQYRGAA